MLFEEEIDKRHLLDFPSTIYGGITGYQFW